MVACRHIASSLPGLRIALALVAFVAIAALAPAHARYTVYYYQDGRVLNNLAQAEALIASTSPVAVQYLDVLDISDGLRANHGGHFTQTTTIVPLDVKDRFAVFATGEFYVPTSMIYTFMVRSDDGMRLSVNGTQLVQFTGNRGPGDSFSAPRFLDAGWHRLDVIYFENAGGAVLEVAFAPGAHTRFNPLAFSLVAATPEPSTWAMMMIAFGLVAMQRKRLRRAARRTRQSCGAACV